jgi:hypothetical protein
VLPIVGRAPIAWLRMTMMQMQMEMRRMTAAVRAEGVVTRRDA